MASTILSAAHLRIPTPPADDSDVADSQAAKLSGPRSNSRFTNDEDIKVTTARLATYGNPALFVTPNREIEMRESPIPIPSATQVLIHVRCTGICGSDLHLWHRGQIGPLRVTYPSILGHEASGIILTTGSAVTHLRKGDRIAIEPGVPCGQCFLCSSGKYNLCQSVGFAGVCPHAGTIQRFMVHEAEYCHKLPDTMSYAQGALLEPLSVILHAVSQCKTPLQIGKPALICGAGPIGLIALATARASGAWPLVITDIDQSRLQFVEGFSPGVQTYLIDNKKSPMEVAEDIRSLFKCGEGSLRDETPYTQEYNAPSTILECTGVESSVATAAYCCRRGGSLMVVGVGQSLMNNLPFMHLSLAEIDLQFINRYRDTWPAGINALTDHRVMNLDSLVTHTVPLARAVDAMHLAADKFTSSIKIQIVDDEDISL